MYELILEDYEWNMLVICILGRKTEVYYPQCIYLPKGYRIAGIEVPGAVLRWVKL